MKLPVSGSSLARRTCSNTHGYLGTPVSKIMQAVGLQKGGIYRHFESRDALAREAFEYAVARIRERCMEALAGKKTAAEKLYALSR